MIFRSIALIVLFLVTLVTQSFAHNTQSTNYKISSNGRFATYTAKHEDILKRNYTM